jgi:uncharacterized membrane protein
VPIAIGGFVLSFVADLIGYATDTRDPWSVVAYWTMIGGILAALVAAIPGLFDLLSLPPGPLKRTAITHMVINLTVVGLFSWNAWLRYLRTQDTTLPLALSAIAIVLLLISGWLGGKMVYEAGVGVNDDTRPL